MCALERNTDRRGRWAVPLTRLRMWRLRRQRFRSVGFSILTYPAMVYPRCTAAELAGRLANLAEDGLLGVLDALALVGLRRPEAAHLGGGGAQELLVDAAQHDDVLVHRRGDAVRQVVVDRVRVAEL